FRSPGLPFRASRTIMTRFSSFFACSSIVTKGLSAHRRRCRTNLTPAGKDSYCRPAMWRRTALPRKPLAGERTKTDGKAGRNGGRSDKHKRIRFRIRASGF
ncbi:MAG: hypothetical protein IJO84_04190, partial [Butyricimonas sp.]|nr:hypothetical protein [Butyricimonas sp.]